MLELLASGGKTRGALYPDSGPGSKELVKGDETFGLFGTLSASEFFTTQELSDAVDYTVGSVVTIAPEWVKVMMDGQVLFIPSVQLRNTAGWESLYNAGLIYGVETNGKYPVGSGVPQNKIVNKGGSLFRVRVFGKGDLDPSTVNSQTTSLSPSNYELGRFCTKIYGDPQTGGAFLNSWKLYGMSIISGKHVVQIPTSSANISNTAYPRWVNRSNNYFFDGYVIGKDALPASTYWWPVLELLPSDTVVPIKNVGNDVSRTLLPIAPGEITTEGEYIKPVNKLYGYTTGHLLQGAITELTYEKPTDWVVPIAASSIRQGSLIPISVSSMTVEQ